jgi:hypothetical protein
LFSTPYEGKETSAGPWAASSATLLQGSSTSLPATLAHSYTPICTAGSSPCIYKGDVQDLPKGGQVEKARADAKEANSDGSLQGQTLSLSLATLVTPTTSTPVQDNISLIPPLVFHLASTHLAGTRSIKFTGRLRVLTGPKRRQVCQPTEGMRREWGSLALGLVYSHSRV